MTDRMTYREENRSREYPPSAPLTELLGKDSIPDYRIHCLTSPAQPTLPNSLQRLPPAPCFPTRSWRACGSVWGSVTLPSSPRSGRASI